MSGWTSLARVIQLIDDDLGTLTIDEYPFVLVSFEIGSPEVRVVSENRAWQDGADDTSTWTGAAAVTVVTRLVNKQQSCFADGKVWTMQQLVDQVKPFMSSKRRPLLTWTLPGSGERRGIVVAGRSSPLRVAGPLYPVVPLSFVAPDGAAIMSIDPERWPHCETIDPSGDTEPGRTYDQRYDKTYPASAGVGARKLSNPGNAPTHYVCRLYGECVDPLLWVNGTLVEFTGLSVPFGSFVTIDTKELTIRFNDEPTESRFSLTNFTAWEWDDLLLSQGDNLIRFNAATLGAGARAEFCYTPMWAA